MKYNYIEILKYITKKPGGISYSPQRLLLKLLQFSTAAQSMWVL